MISFEVFLFGLFVTSILTGLTTEAVKKGFTELNISYKANTLAGIIAVVISSFIGCSYITTHGMSFDFNTITCLIAQMFMSWLCAMIGYDKVIQTISQFKSPK